MSSPGHCTGAYFNGSISSRGFIGQAAYGGLLICATSTALLLGGRAAHSGPCTAQIAQLEQQINRSPPGPETGPTATQSVAAQLHQQPTPHSVEHAERKANKVADAALDRARRADAKGDARACAKALGDARRLYDMD
jgi:hypothetical protein